MLGSIVFTYGMLTSFVLQGATRNARLARPNPPMLQYIGYVLCGLSAGLSILLLIMAATARAPFPLM
jgi:hypothetical protein